MLQKQHSPQKSLHKMTELCYDQPGSAEIAQLVEQRFCKP